MGIAQHPEYIEHIGEWHMLRDSFAGEKVIKEKGAKYLPPTPGQVLDGMSVNGGGCNESSPGFVSYQNYKMRAVYPDFFEAGVRTLVGILNEKPPKVTVPKEMEYLLKDCTFGHESLSTFMRGVHAELLITGRAGLFADLPKDPDQRDPRHYLAMYQAEHIVNWDDGTFNDGFNKLNLVVLDESGYKRTATYNWQAVQKYRVLALGAVGENEAIGNYRYAEAEGGDAPEDSEFRAPSFRGRESQEIPFVFVGPNDLNTKPSTPPLIGLARLCLTIYRGEADYRYSLFMQGQETLVVIGGIRAQSVEDNNKPLRVGADARIDVDMGGDAKYVGIGSTGIPEQRAALESDRELAAVRTGQLLAPGKMSMESGEALKTRVAAQTATLTSIANSSAAALEEILKKVARWRGLDDSKVSVTPNLDFSNFQIMAQDLVQLITAKRLGYPISFQSMHDISRERGLTRNTFEEELELIKKDPNELVEIINMQTSLTGNNPLQSAGGPKDDPTRNEPPSNKPKK